MILAYAIIGLVAAGFGLSIGQLVAALIDPAFAPISVVASSLIDLPPAVVKEFMVQTFGTAAKSVVVAGVWVVVLVLAATAGVLARRALWRGILVTDLVAVLGVVAALARPDDGFGAAVPVIAAGLASTVALAVLVRFAAKRPSTQGAPATPSAPTADQEAGTTSPTSVNRRAVLIAGLGFAGLAAAAMGAAQFLGSRTSAVASRVNALLPTPVEPAAALPSGVQAPISGIQPFVTPNASFYRIDTAVIVPQVQAQGWSLEFSGMVRRPYTITYDELLAMPMVERDVTIMCVSNPIGGNYIGNARWLGTPLMPLLEQAGIESTADQLFSTSVDGSRPRWC
ncbi:MAG: molybdopterin-dependent oxidoreductase [Actinomycetales bacterium]